jgi:hypothetical protein
VGVVPTIFARDHRDQLLPTPASVVLGTRFFPKQKKFSDFPTDRVFESVKIKEICGFLL